DDAEERSKAAVVHGRFEGTVRDEDDVVGLQNRVGVFAVQDALDVQLDDAPVVAIRANEADVVEFALEGDSAAQCGCFHQRQRRVLRQGYGSGRFEGAEHVNHADAADDDGVAGKDRNVGQATVERVCAEVDDQRLGDAGAADGDDVAGSWRQTTGDGEDVQQAARTDDRNHCVNFANDRRGLIGALSKLDRDLRAAIDLGVYKALLDDPLGLRDRFAV